VGQLLPAAGKDRWEKDRTQHKRSSERWSGGGCSRTGAWAVRVGVRCFSARQSPQSWPQQCTLFFQGQTHLTAARVSHSSARRSSPRSSASGSTSAELAPTSAGRWGSQCCGPAMCCKTPPSLQRAELPHAPFIEPSTHPPGRPPAHLATRRPTSERSLLQVQPLQKHV